MPDHLTCPSCGSSDITVADSRPARLGDIPTIRRRRKCRACDHRSTTYELGQEVIHRIEISLAVLARLKALFPDAATAVEAERMRKVAGHG
jgi:transcriptional regulator NrdR family protein